MSIGGGGKKSLNGGRNVLSGLALKNSIYILGKDLGVLSRVKRT